MAEAKRVTIMAADDKPFTDPAARRRARARNRERDPAPSSPARRGGPGRAPRAVAAGCLIALALAGCALDDPAAVDTGGGAAEPAPSEPAEPSVPDGVPEDAQAAEVEEVTGADAVRVLALGGGTDGPLPEGESTEVLLSGIDAPASGECFADEAADRTDLLLAPGETVYIGDADDTGDGLLAHVWSADGTWVNEDLLSSGHAEYASADGSSDRAADLREAADAAEQAGEGLWTECAPEPPPEPEPPQEPEEPAAPEVEEPEPAEPAEPAEPEEPAAPDDGIIMAPSGKHYAAGQFCKHDHLGQTTQDASGHTLLCAFHDGEANARWKRV
ncbi:thermonuclease family protein [Nocardiopsis sp. RSe5-2]|uniref:Thermonuclease family protein n=1 Tax=Nocardiopsis endophytica TaxID=3018445 RepID=A0ABT4U847_9ACTN|nr:thermonuclease family protein [Nocardiopsis endophytica]MDA2813131.1 thermonuclease family protein [Nocardiopsis endophytica]